MSTWLLELLESRAGTGRAGESDQGSRCGLPGLDPENPFLLSNRDLVSRLETKASPILGWQD
jgi:hypothetical protein